MHRHIPNLLTLTRIALLPILVLVNYLPVNWAPLATTSVFILAALTDWLDGHLARRWHLTSAFGAFLDPVADKLMVATALVLVLQHNPTVWMALPVLVIISREITISALREWMASLGASTQVAVSQIGKIKTTAQMTAIICLLYQHDFVGLPTYTIGITLLYLAVVLTLWSMLIYLRAAWPELRKQQHL
ncbi:MAG: CDP-diacylglycerol--glycerol-3-phosphate 3-phosphatidyltransferase [Pseudomonadota bacterium]